MGHSELDWQAEEQFVLICRERAKAFLTYDACPTRATAAAHDSLYEPWMGAGIRYLAARYEQELARLREQL